MVNDASQRTDPSSADRVRTTNLTRFSLLLGALLFGGVIWFIHRDPQWQPEAPDVVQPLRLATYGVWAVAIVGALIMRGIHARASDQTRHSTALIGPAFGESVALFGGVYYFMTDDPWRYLYGLVFLLATFILFPVRRR